jgi:MFS family permease
MIQPSSVSFVRDQFTWLAYLMLAYYAYMQAAVSQLMLFLSQELDLNYTVRSYHLSAFAFGMVLAGIHADRVARRFGRRTAFWAGGLGMALGAVLLASGRHVAVTVAACFATGFLGSYLLVMIQATLSDKHGTRRAVALTEANIVASVATGLAPLLVGGFQSLGLGWRTALAIGIVCWVLMTIIWWKTVFPQPQPLASVGGSSKVSHTKLPLSFWAYILVVFINVAIEWSMIFWGAEFLETAVEFSSSISTSLMTAFFVAMVIGRVIGSRLTRKFHSARLLVAAIGIVIIGFPLFWLPRFAPLNLLGLFIVGLGIANLFPLTLAMATSAAPQHANIASARVSMASGSAILIAPQILGSVGDHVGIESAYGIVALLVLIALLVTIIANRLAMRERSLVELEQRAAAIQQ